MTNIYAEHRRTLKAQTLADTLLAAHAGLNTDVPCSRIVRGMSDAEWAKAADAASVNLPSRETRELCATMIERREQVARATEAVA